MQTLLEASRLDFGFSGPETVIADKEGGDGCSHCNYECTCQGCIWDG